MQIDITHNMPKVVADHIAVCNAHDAEAWMATFAPGASIPKALWSFMGGPFEGKYRNGSIIHDFYCGKRHKPWKAVHRMFYDAILTSGVGMKKAQIMYTAVYWAGPKWTEMDVHNSRIPSVVVTGRGDVSQSHQRKAKRSLIVEGKLSEAQTLPITSYRRLAPSQKKLSTIHGKKVTVNLGTPAFTEKDLELLLKELKTNGADLKSIEKQVGQIFDPDLVQMGGAGKRRIERRSPSKLED
jgi:hypothetical protein